VPKASAAVGVTGEAVLVKELGVEEEELATSIISILLGFACDCVPEARFLRLLSKKKAKAPDNTNAPTATPTPAPIAAFDEELLFFPSRLLESVEPLLPSDIA